MERPIPLILSVPTSAAGATAAATFSFFTTDYRPPRQPRMSSRDVVVNQNGIFPYDYDNGPGLHAWSPFTLSMTDEFPGFLPSATQQRANLKFLWQYVEGGMRMEGPDGDVYDVHWAPGTDLERQFLARSGAAGDKQRAEQRIIVQFVEG
jgi:hypothetical protein